jgi:hypothetical protein
VYFYRKGRGRYRAAPPDTLKAALAGIEKKKQQQLQISAWSDRLARGELPEEFRAILPQLLHKPDRNRPETKALEDACARTGLSPAKLAERCGALPSSHDYHLGRFLCEYFPKGTGFPPGLEVADPGDLPLAEVTAFSLDDSATTEIDDAFSLAPLAGDRVRVGIHIAAPGLGFSPGSPLDAVARERLSTVYMPGHKLTMLPEQAIGRFSLAHGKARPRPVSGRAHGRFRGRGPAYACRADPHCREPAPPGRRLMQLSSPLGARGHSISRDCMSLTCGRARAARGKPSGAIDVRTSQLRVEGSGEAAREHHGAPARRPWTSWSPGDDRGQRRLGQAGRSWRPGYLPRADGRKVRMATSAMAHQGLG